MGSLTVACHQEVSTTARPLRAARRWPIAKERDMAIPTTGEERIEIDAPPGHVYDLVADLTRMGEWSPECYRVDWVGDAAGPVVGTEFEGHNRIGPYRWTVGGKVVTADPGREFAFTTYLNGRESTRDRKSVV